jgi:tetratricopeptide (TPR) repeat protein
MPTLTDRKAMGGIIALKGFNFQRNYALILLIESLANPEFKALMVEGAEDVESSGVARNAVQVKNHDLTIAEFMGILQDFYKLDSASPGTWAQFVIICTGLDDKVNTLHRHLERYHNGEAFYAAEDGIRVETLEALRVRFKELGGGEHGVPFEFLLERVSVRTDLLLYQNQELVRSQALELLHRLYPKPSYDILDTIYNRLANLVAEFTGKALFRQEVLDIIQAEIDKFKPPDVDKKERRFLNSPLQRAENFTGREKELEWLLERLQPGRAVTLVAAGGMGKTALVAEALIKLPEERFPDGIFTHTFYHQPQVAVCLEAICRLFGLEPVPDVGTAASMALAERKLLLVLDGAEQADDLQAVLSVRGECGVLITSRKRSDVPDFEHFWALKPLPEAKSLALLKKWGGKCAADNAAGKEIIKICGGLPLAIRLVGRFLRSQNQPAAEYLEWLQTTPLEAMDQGERQLESVPVLMERSLSVLSEQAGRLLGVMGVLAYAPLPVELFKPALGLPELEERRALAALVDYGLVLKPKAAERRVELAHALVHTYASQRLSPPVEGMSGLVELLCGLFELGTEKGAEGFKVLDGLRAHMLALQRWMLVRQQWKEVIDITWAADGYLDLSGHWAERMAILQAGYQAARQARDRNAEAGFMTNMGNAYASLGQVEKAIEYHQKALVIDREIGDRRGEGNDLGNLGIAYRSLGQVEKAIEYYKQALVIQREIGDLRGEGADLGNLGIAYRSLGQVEKAIEYYQQALAIQREIGDRRGEGNQLGNLGNAYADLGQVEKAIEYYQRILVIHREIGDRRGEGADLGNLGIAYYRLGQVEKAIEYYQQQLVIVREIGDRLGEGQALGNLGIAYASLGQVEKAIEFYLQALVIQREIGNRHGEGAALGNLGSAYGSLGQVDKAIEYYQQQLVIVREIGDRRGEGNALSGLGIAYHSLGQVEKAIEYHQKALVIDREIGDRHGEGNDLGNLGNAYAYLEQVEKAIEYFKQALVIARQIGDRYAEGMHLSNLAITYAKRGELARAVPLVVQAWKIFAEIKSPEMQRAEQILGMLRGNMGEEAFKQALEGQTEG